MAVCKRRSPVALSTALCTGESIPQQGAGALPPQERRDDVLSVIKNAIASAQNSRQRCRSRALDVVT